MSQSADNDTNQKLGCVKEPSKSRYIWQYVPYKMDHHGIWFATWNGDATSIVSSANQPWLELEFINLCRWSPSLFPKPHGFSTKKTVPKDWMALRVMIDCLAKSWPWFKTSSQITQISAWIKAIVPCSEHRNEWTSKWNRWPMDVQSQKKMLV